MGRLSDDSGKHHLLARRRSDALDSSGRSTDAVYAAVLRELAVEEAAGAVLDFGAGKGLLTQLLVDSGQFDRVVAVDIIDYGLPQNAEFFLGDLNQPVSLPDESFDVVLAVGGLLGSLENPFQTCREWSRLLKPTGAVVGTVVNIESVRALIALVARGHFAGFGLGSPVHLPLGRGTVNDALTMAGFEAPRWFFSDRGTLPLPSARVTWQQVSLGLLRGVRFSNTCGFVARKEPRKKVS